VWHPSDHEIRQFLDGDLAASALEALEVHLDSCDACEPRLVQMARQRAGDIGQAAPGSLFAQGSTISRFVLLTLRGRGGMGTVYAAFDPQLDRKVALKVLDAWADEAPQRRTRMLAEARSLAQLSHPNVVAIHDAGESDGVAWVAMEFVDGQTLAQWLEQPHVPREIISRFIEAGEGLAAAHARGLVHGDFKPANVLLSSDGRVRVSDFGLATRSGAQSLGGTKRYQAPEVEVVDARADQFSFAKALSEALGTHGVSTRVRQALKKAVAPEPSHRFDDLPALLRELEPPRGRRGLVVAAALLLLGLVAGFAARSQAGRCETSSVLDEVWSPTQQRQVHDVFTMANASKAGEVVEAGLNRWRASWAQAAREACLAARAGTAPQRLTELRTLCLEERRREVLALTKAFIVGEPDAIRRARSAVDAITPPTTCADARALLEEDVRPTEPTARAELERLEAIVAAAKIEKDLGRVVKAKAALEPVLSAARTLGFRPLTAKVAYRLGSLQVRLGQHLEALPLLEEAVTQGLAGRSDDSAARAAVLLVYEAGVTFHRPEEGERWARLADALLTRRGGDPDVKAGLLLDRSLLAESGSHLTEAIALAREAIAVSPQPSTLANVWLNLARQLRYADQLADAETASNTALTMTRTTGGDEHPNTGLAQLELGELAVMRNQPAVAKAHFEAALALAKPLGARHAATGDAMVGLARVASMQGQGAAALTAIKEALAVIDASAGPSSEQARVALISWAEVALEAGSRSEAKAAQARFAAFTTPFEDPHTAKRAARIGERLQP